MVSMGMALGVSMPTGGKRQKAGGAAAEQTLLILCLIFDLQLRSWSIRVLF
jgi:hypothetical protein